MYGQFDASGNLKSMTTAPQDMTQPCFAGLTEQLIDDADPRIAAFNAAAQAALNVDASAVLVNQVIADPNAIAALKKALGL